MKFRATNIHGQEVTGTGVTGCADKYAGLEDRNLMFLFNGDLEWYDGHEFRTEDFEIVFAETVKVEEI